MRAIANILSVLLHPLWMPTLALWLVLELDRSVYYTILPGGHWILLAMVFAMTGLFPLTSTLVMKRSGMVSSLSMPVRRERVPVYVIVFLYYVMCYYLLRRTPVDPMLLSTFFGAGLALFLTLLITLRWKISAHMVGIGGVLGVLLAVMMIDDVHAPLWMSTAFIVTGTLGTARLLVSDHTPAQIYSGAVLGCACVLVCAAFAIHL